MTFFFFYMTQVAGNSTAGNSLFQLNCPWGIYVDENSTVYVVDRNNHRVQKWLSGIVFAWRVKEYHLFFN